MSLTKIAYGLVQSGTFKCTDECVPFLSFFAYILISILRRKKTCKYMEFVYRLCNNCNSPSLLDTRV